MHGARSRAGVLPIVSNEVYPMGAPRGEDLNEVQGAKSIIFSTSGGIHFNL